MDHRLGGRGAGGGVIGAPVPGFGRDGSDGRGGWRGGRLIFTPRLCSMSLGCWPTLDLPLLDLPLQVQRPERKDVVLGGPA